MIREQAGSESVPWIVSRSVPRRDTFGQLATCASQGNPGLLEPLPSVAISALLVQGLVADDLPLDHRSMTTDTCNPSVYSVQGKSRVAVVIEQQTSPSLEGMTSRAYRRILVDRKLPEMRIFMTCRALLGHAVEGEPQILVARHTHPVAIETTGLLMTTHEAVVGAFMIKLHPTPPGHLVTGQAVLLEHETRQRLFVGILVTSGAQGGGNLVPPHDLPCVVSGVS